MMILDRTTAPAIGDFPEMSLQDIVTTTLPNGVRLNVLDTGEQDIIALGFDWPSGRMDVDNPAALMLMMQLLREGTHSRTGFEISETLDFNGAWVKSTAEAHNVVTSFFLLSRTAADLIALMADIVSNATFPEKEFETLRARAAAKARVNEKNVQVVCSNLNDRQVFGNRPMLKAVKPEVIEATTRDEVVEAYNRILRATPPTVWLTGRCAAILPALTEALSAMEFTGENPVKAEIMPIDVKESSTEKACVDNALQTAIMLSIPTIGRSHPDYIDLRLAIMALGGYFGSRLMSNLREDKGLTYGVSASLLGHREGGVATISLQCDPRYVATALREIEAEIDDMSRNPMAADELEAMRSYAMSSLVSILDSPLSMIDLHMAHEHSGTPEHYFDLQQKAIRAITSEKITDLMHRHIAPAPRLLTLVGPSPVAER